MIFNNYVTNGTVLTSTIWNRAWGFEGTAKSVYDALGGQQHHSNIYGAFSWGTAIQGLTTLNETIQFSFITGTTYPSSERAGSLNNWKSGMIVVSDFRDSILIQRDGYYLIHAEFSINDSTNRICSSTNTDGCTTVPDNSIYMEITTNNVTDRGFWIRPNTVKAATYNAAQNVAPHGSVFVNFFETFQKGQMLKLRTNVVDGAARNERIINASLKAFLIKATQIDDTNYYIDPY